MEAHRIKQLPAGGRCAKSCLVGALQRQRPDARQGDLRCASFVHPHTFAPELLLKAQGIRAAIFDVDGVLTDGFGSISEAGETLKTFNVLDGHGLGCWPGRHHAAGRDRARLACPRRRLADLGLQRLGARDKVAAAEQLLSNLQVGWDACRDRRRLARSAPDAARARFVAAPAQAHRVRALADYVTALPGGLGAAREFCDLLLIASGRYADCSPAARWPRWTPPYARRPDPRNIRPRDEIHLADGLSGSLPIVLLIPCWRRAPGGWCATPQPDAPRLPPAAHEVDYEMRRLRRGAGTDGARRGGHAAT